MRGGPHPWWTPRQDLVDWTPLELGRDLEGLLRVSRATGLHVVAATGCIVTPTTRRITPCAPRRPMA